MAFDISNYAQALDVSPERDIETITQEILTLKKKAGESIIGIGQRLIEAKATLPHGEWLPWLTERVEFSERSAQRFMRLSREWTKSDMLSDLGATKALQLLALPPEERERFMHEAHTVNGQEKTVIDMTSRELEKAICERDEARKAAEAARAEAKTAEESRAKMETDLAALKQLHQGAQAAEEEARRKLSAALAELKAQQDRPVDVPVMAVDQAALDRARREGAAEMQAKLDHAEEVRKKAEERRKALETEMESMRKKLDAAGAAEKRAALSGDKDFARFEVLFAQTNENINKLHGLLLKFRGRDDGEMAAKLQKALLALADMVRGCAE